MTTTVMCLLLHFYSSSNKKHICRSIGHKLKINHLIHCKQNLNVGYKTVHINPLQHSDPKELSGVYSEIQLLHHFAVTMAMELWEIWAFFKCYTLSVASSSSCFLWKCCHPQMTRSSSLHFSSLLHLFPSRRVYSVAPLSTCASICKFILTWDLWCAFQLVCKTSSTSA